MGKGFKRAIAAAKATQSVEYQCGFCPFTETVTRRVPHQRDWYKHEGKLCCEACAKERGIAVE